MSTTDLAALSGLELMRRIQSARPTDTVPPSIGRLLGMRFEEVEHGRMVISLDTAPTSPTPSASSTAASRPPFSTP
ncbi:hypothetical protein [Streptomyces sp. NPDC001980]|uniref:hypothetical protein n=1 Tax=Streptomyces sp. NPDC001980 TaxID=3157126 RepID=UPI00331E09ED